MRRRDWLISAFATAAAPAASPPARGFRGAAWDAQMALESRLRAVPSPLRLEAHMKAMASEPHHAGSPASKAVAEYALRQFRKAGWQARLETFEPFLPYPRQRLVELVAPVSHRLRLQEPNFAADPDSNDRNQIPTYNAYSGAGDVTGELVYVNYGVPDDYETLRKRGVDVRGKVVLARYGQSWRGVKPKVAAEHGAIACLIYSDPADDGFGKGAVYPDGPFRCEQGVQRGSVMDMSIHVGDPLTPGWASEKGARRIAMSESKILMPIPVLPISYGDAKPLFDHLGGPEVSREWAGGLPVQYRFGPGPARVRVALTFDNANRPIHNVIATLKGSVYPNQWVLYGNHHDAWVNGAHDPISGAAALLEAARACGSAYRAGWRPRRTLVFALWDAEEFGLIGSTEWVEKHIAELSDKAVVYFNGDSNGKGRLQVGASPSLSAFLEEVARDVAARTEKEWRVTPLGSGSDYVPFLHHTGIAAANLGYSGEDAGGVYHSVFDSLAWYKRFSDGTFAYGKALAEFMAVAVARMSDAPLPPFQFTRLASTIQSWWVEVSRIADDKKVVLPVAEARAAIQKMASLASAFESAYAGGAPTEESARAIYLLERNLLLTESGGLPGRPWYRHALSAPGQYTGYGAKTLPGVREALELDRPDEARSQALILVRCFDRFNRALEAAIAKLRQSKASD